MRKITKWSCGLLAAGILILGTVYALRARLIAPRLSQFIVATVQSELGVKLKIDHISGTYFSNLELSGLKTVQPNITGPLKSLDLTSLRVGYSLPAILSGIDVFLGKVRIEIDGARISLRLPEKSSQSDNKALSLTHLPPRLPSLRITDATIAITGNDARSRFEGVSLVSRPGRSGGTLLKLAVSDWSWQHPGLHDRNVALAAEATLTRESLTVEKLNIGDALLVASARIDLRKAPKVLPYQVEAQLFNGQIHLAGQWIQSRLELQTSAARLDLSVLPTIVKLPVSGLDGSLGWDADAHWNTASPASSSARLSLSISKGQIEGVPIESVDLKAGLSEERITIEKLSAGATGSTLVFEDVQVPAPLLFDGEFQNLIGRTNGEFSIHSENLPAIFGALGRPSATLLPAPAHSMTLLGRLGQGFLTVTAGRLTTAFGGISLGSLAVQIPTAERTWARSMVSGSARVDISELRPIGRLFGLPELKGALKASIDVSGRLGAPLGHTRIDGDNIFWRNFSADTVVVDASANEERLTLKSLDIRNGPDSVSGQAAYRWAEGHIEKARFDLNLAVLNRYTAILANAFDGLDPRKVAIGGRLKGQVSLNGPLVGPDGAADLDIDGLTYQERSLGRARVHLRKQGSRVSSKGVHLENGKDSVSLQGSIDLANKSATALSLSVRIADISQYTRGLVPSRWDAAGTIHIDAESSGPLLKPVGRLKADFTRFTFGKFYANTAALRARSDGRLIHLDLAEAKRPHAQLALSAKIQNNWDRGNLALEIGSCDFRWHDLKLALPQPAQAAYTRNGSFSVANMVLDGRSGRVAIDGNWSQTGASDLRINLADLTGGDWFGVLAGERLRFKGLDAAIHLTGKTAQPNMAATASVSTIRIRDYPHPLKGEFDFSYVRKGLTIKRLAMSGVAGPRLSLTGKFPLQALPRLVFLPGPVEAAGTFSIPDLKLINAVMSRAQVKNGNLEGEFQFGGSWRQLDGRLQFRGRSLEVDTDWQPLPPGPYSVDGALSVKGSRLSIKSLQFNSPGLTFAGQGNWNKMPSPADLIRKTALNPGGELAFEGKLVIPDLGWLARGMSSLRRTNGKLEAELSLTGPVTKPDFQTSVRITDGELHTNIGMPSLRAIDLSARLNTQGLELDRLDARMGGSPVRASGTYKWKASDPRAVDLSVEGTNLLLYRDENILMRADTDLKLRGPLERMALTGDMLVTKGLIKKNLNIFGLLKGPGGPKSGSGLRLFSLPEPPFRNLEFDVRVRTQSRIDLRGNIAQGSIRPDLRLAGTGLLPVLKGKIYTDTTRVSLPAGRVTIESGVIEFLESDPEVPNLELKGRTRMLGYDISILAQGPYNEPEITLSSIPPLPGDDLMLLLLTGQPPKGALGRRGRKRQSIQVAIYVAKDLMSSLFSGNSSEDLEDILDRFDFEVGRDVTRSGDETIEAQFRIKSGLILERDRVYITGEKDAYDYFNTGIKLVFRFK